MLKVLTAINTRADRLDIFQLLLAKVTLMRFQKRRCDGGRCGPGSLRSHATLIMHGDSRGGARLTMADLTRLSPVFFQALRSSRAFSACLLNPAMGSHVGRCFTARRRAGAAYAISTYCNSALLPGDSRMGKKSTSMEPGLPLSFVPFTARSASCTIKSFIDVSRCPYVISSKVPATYLQSIGIIVGIHMRPTGVGYRLTYRDAR